MPDRSRLQALLVAADPAVRARLSGHLVAAEEVAAIHLAADVEGALDTARSRHVDVVLASAQLPDGTAITLARGLTEAHGRPAVVILADSADLAVEAFEVGACDYLVRPISDARLSAALRRAAERRAVHAPRTNDETIAVDLAGTRTFLRRSQVTHATADGDYVRLHTAADTHLVRASIGDLERRWADAGFVRVHRSALVALPHVTAARTERGRLLLEAGGASVLVSRRHTPQVRALLDGSQPR